MPRKKHTKATEMPPRKKQKTTTELNPFVEEPKNPCVEEPVKDEPLEPKIIPLDDFDVTEYGQLLRPDYKTDNEKKLRNMLITVPKSAACCTKEEFHAKLIELVPNAAIIATGEEQHKDGDDHLHAAVNVSESLRWAPLRKRLAAAGINCNFSMHVSQLFCEPLLSMIIFRFYDYF